MELSQQKPDNTAAQDEDVQFERDKESTIIPLTESGDDQSKNSATEGVLPTKEETLGNSDFPLNRIGKAAQASG